MKKVFSDSIKERYNELIQYIFLLGYKSAISYESQVEIIIEISDYFENKLLKIKLFQPLDREWEYNYHRLRISWAIPPNECLGNCRWYPETNNQAVIFNTLLYDLINYKLDNIDKTTVDSSNILIYSILKDWFKDREPSFIEEKALSNQSIWTKFKSIFKF